MSRIGRYLLYEVAVVARIGGRHDPNWALFAVGRGCSGLARVGGRYEPYWVLVAA